MLWVPKGLIVGIVGFALEVRAEFSAKYHFFTCDPLFVEVRCLIFSELRFFQHSVKMLMLRLWSIVTFGRCVWARKSRDIQLATFRRHTPATSRRQISNLLCVFSMELGNHIDETTSGKSPSGSRVGVVADARHCGVSSMRAQAKNQIAQFLPNPGRRILGGAIRNVGNICLRIRFRSHAHDVCSSLAEVSPCGNPPFPCVSKCGCSW